MHEHLVDHTKHIPTYSGQEPRRIGRTDKSMLSNFPSSVGRAIRNKFTNLLVDIQSFVDFKIKGGDKLLKLVLALSRSKDWTKLLPDIVEFNSWQNRDEFDKYDLFVKQEEGFEPIELEEIDRSYIIGQDKNVERLYNNLEAFVSGSEINHILLYGETGTGKTLSMKAMINEIKGLKMILLSSIYLGSLKKFSQYIAKKPYHTILYIDDMHLDFTIWEGFKTTLSGMVDFPSNVRLAVSANPEAYDHLPPSIKRRFGLKLDYAFNMGEEELRRGVLEANCKLLGIDYSPELLETFDGIHKDGFDDVSPGHAYDFLVEQKALSR